MANQVRYLVTSNLNFFGNFFDSQTQFWLEIFSFLFYWIEIWIDWQLVRNNIYAESVHIIIEQNKYVDVILKKTDEIFFLSFREMVTNPSFFNNFYVSKGSQSQSPLSLASLDSQTISTLL